MNNQVLQPIYEESGAFMISQAYDPMDAAAAQLTKKNDTLNRLTLTSAQTKTQYARLVHRNGDAGLSLHTRTAPAPACQA